ncbi:cytochrome P450 [Nigerium massiliense]|uniref:cytochrome P450 n=1 Tax=Nigerium massiliense TaxID=1522317 RepID=UPI000AEB700F|nr:cytochrome P450 [Nigerium massiliense]
MSRPDVAVVGLGPAGRALSHRLLAAGADVLVVDTDPDRAWWQVYGGWAWQLPSWLPAATIGARVGRPALRALGDHRLADSYVVLDTAGLQAALTLDGARVRRGTVAEDELAGLAPVVVDGRGAWPRRAGSGGTRLPAWRPAQTAFGLALDPEVLGPLMDGAAAVLMDWRPYDGARNWGRRAATFCYLIPLGDGRILAEETSLAAAPPLGQRELARRLRVRLHRAGVPDATIDGAVASGAVERVAIPLVAAPRSVDVGVVRFGAAGAQSNPVTGYSVFASLQQADALATTLLSGTGPASAARPQSNVRVAAMAAVTRLDGDRTRELFDAFARLPRAEQRAVFDPATSRGPLIAALGRQALRLRPSAVAALTRATARGMVDAHGVLTNRPADPRPEPAQASVAYRPARQTPGSQAAPPQGPSPQKPAEGQRGSRRAVRPGEADVPRVERTAGMWRLRAMEPALQVLRARHSTTQAGFTAEYIPQGRLRHRPILISDGPAHDGQRKKVARFFAPAVVEERYLGQMEESADALLAEAAATGRLLLDDLALHYAVEVTAEIVGLTHHASRDSAEVRHRRTRAMASRLVRFFNQPPFDLTRADLGRSPVQWARAAANGLAPVVAFHLADVRPALRQRRRRPGDDVLSHLLAEGYSTMNILIESVTYGTAGMVTTREFICMAAWHLLGDDRLRDRYRGAARPERLAILAEVIRLEPVVGHLYRRVREPLEISDGDRTWCIPAGDLVDVCVRPANADERAVGPDALSLCPGRTMADGVKPAGLAFGDGAHRCPGQPLALLEADVLLTRLFAHAPTIVREPELGWDDLIAGYRLRGFELRLGR